MSDERVYADFSEPGIVWTGRHDNAMGKGKGSSIRHLLPEEAIRMAHLLLTEPDQTVGAPAGRHAPTGKPLTYPNGSSIEDLPLSGQQVLREDEIYFTLTRQVHSPGSHLRLAIDPHLPHGITWDNLEYASSQFAWGYTAATADYVLIFRGQQGRKFIVVFECMRGSVREEAVLQVMLYIERVVQVAALSAPTEALPPHGVDIEVLPVVIAFRFGTRRGGDSRLGVPQPYRFRRDYLGGNHVSVLVRSPVLLTYSTSNGVGGSCPARAMAFQPESPARVIPITWSPARGRTGTAIEIAHIMAGEWRESVQRALRRSEH